MRRAGTSPCASRTGLAVACLLVVNVALPLAGREALAVAPHGSPFMRWGVMLAKKVFVLGT